MQEGRAVLVTGLVSRPDLNDKLGKLLQYDAAADRWGVDVERERVRIKTCNLRPVGSMTLVPAEEPDLTAPNLRPSGSMHIVNSQDVGAEIVKKISTPSGVYELRFDDFAEFMGKLNLGDTAREVEANLRQGDIFYILICIHRVARAKVDVGDAAVGLAPAQLDDMDGGVIEGEGGIELYPTKGC